ncbi:MAG: HAMP domain-containing histidine kinase [Rhodospirillales bacterium]|nr:HAMP domain-containing histidine kinase [Rhodospirillales bacterium]
MTRLESWVRSLWRISGFRLALFGALASLAGTMLVFGIIYHAADAGWHAHLNQRVADAQADILLDIQNNPDELLRDVQTEVVEGNGMFYAVLAPNGQWEAGNFRLTADLADHWKGSEVLFGQPGVTLPNHVLAVCGTVVRLPDGERLIIAADASGFVTIKKLLAHSFLAVFGTILALGILISLLTARGTLRRVDRFATTLREIMEGDLNSRIKVSNSADEFDRLAEETNQMLQRIQELMENLRQVTNDISHDLRSPLARLRGHLELSKARFTDPALAEVCDEAIAQLDQALEIFSAMLRLAEIEAGARRSQFAPVDLSALLTLLTESFEPVLAEHGIVLRTEIDTGLFVQGDRELLAQLFSNLLDNIVLHAQGATHAFIQASRQDCWIELHITDDGCGIPAEAENLVLRRFYRVDAARQRPGYGLGLPLAQAIAGLHGGNFVFARTESGIAIQVKLLALNV